MYTISVKSHMFIAHSLKHPDFGIAQNLHGATLEIIVTVYSEMLDEMNTVMDIGILKSILSNLISDYNYKNLDDMDEFENKLTTIDFLCSYFHSKISDDLNSQGLSFNDGKLYSMKVEIYESTDAWASYKK